MPIDERRAKQTPWAVPAVIGLSAVFIDLDRGPNLAIAVVHGGVLFGIALWMRVAMIRRNVPKAKQVAALVALLIIDIVAAARLGWR
jgi:hypothetical protein